MSQQMHGPLTGAKVLEIGHYIAGPHCAMMLADQGADVVKLEPLGGEPMRAVPPLSANGDAYAFACHNRRKRSVALDLRRPEAREALDALLKWADIVVTNYSPGVPEKLGFGFENMSEVNPRAVMVHITGFGSTGPRKSYLAYDMAVQAMSGFAELTGAADGPPMVSQFLLADHTVAAHGAFAAACALLERAQTGRGRKVEVSMLQTMISYLSYHVPNAELGQTPKRTGNRYAPNFIDMIQTSDSHVYVMPITAAMRHAFAKAVGASPSADDDRTVDPNDALGRGKHVLEAAARWFGQRKSAEVVAVLQSAGVVCGEARSIAQLCEEERRLASGAVTAVELPRGGVLASVPGPALTMASGDQGAAHIPDLGADTYSVLTEAGLDSDTLQRLAEAGVLRGAA
jgi:crotonobetainyl-CoA:carnitine CoA-transferase CaiB-like acyl-CoA transferase